MKMRPKFIVGVDAGLRNMGVAIMALPKREVERTYVFSTNRGKYQYVAQSNQACIEFLSDRLAQLLTDVRPSTVVAELPTGGAQSSRAAIAMALSFSVVVLTCKRLDIPLFTVTPTEVKRLVSDEKKVPKDAVIAFMSKRYGDILSKHSNAKREHVADAIACLEVFLQQYARIKHQSGN